MKSFFSILLLLALFIDSFGLALEGSSSSTTESLSARRDFLLETLGDQAINKGWIIPPNHASKIGHKLRGWFHGRHELNIVVMGCSSTAGAGTNNAFFDAPINTVNKSAEGLIVNMNGESKNIGVNQVYFKALNDRLMKWPRSGGHDDSSLHMMNAAHGGETTYFTSKLMDGIVGDNVDILFWEFALTDTFIAVHRPSGVKITSQVTIELFLKKASELTSKPSVILLYFWDAHKWPMEHKLWEQHQKTVMRFINDYGMDISVLLGGKLALDVVINKLKLTNTSAYNGNQVKTLYSRNGFYEHPELGGYDHHPSSWTHQTVASALEYAFANITLLSSHHKDNNNNDNVNKFDSMMNKGHNNVRNVYIPSKESIQLRNSIELDKYDGGQWIFLSNMSSSITSFKPRYGKPNNGAYANYSEIIEEGSKASSVRIDRKIDEVVTQCDNHMKTPYHAYFNTPPIGLKWAAVEMSFSPSTYNHPDDEKIELFLTLSNGSNKKFNIIRKMFPKDEIKRQWWSSIKVSSAVFTFDIEMNNSYMNNINKKEKKEKNTENNVNNVNDKIIGFQEGWVDELQVIACVKHVKNDVALKWAIAYAVPV